MKTNAKRSALLITFIGLSVGFVIILCDCDFLTSGSFALDPVKEDDVHADGPYVTLQDLNSGPAGNSGLFYPEDLGRDNFKHPIFLWGCGGITSPSDYTFHMNRIASHGIVVVAEISQNERNGAALKSSLEWIIRENQRPESIFYNKLDTRKIAVGGHSIGAVNALAIADDPRLTTTIYVAGGSLDGKGTEALKLIHPAAYICSQYDMFGNVEKSEADFAYSNVPVFLTIMTGVEHVAAAREGIDAIVAWLRWFLFDETEHRHMFLDPDGEFRNGKYDSIIKNWR